LRKAELEILRMQLEQQRKDREDSERRIMEIANASQETLTQEYESRKQDKIEKNRSRE